MSELKALLTELKGQRTFNLGDGDVNQEAIDLAFRQVHQEVSKSWGAPFYCGLSKGFPLSAYPVDELAGDFLRSWRIALWKKGRACFTAMLTSHDAGSVILLELQVAES